MSARARIWTFSEESSTLSAAPVPRPPHPTSPIFRVCSCPPAYTKGMFMRDSSGTSKAGTAPSWTKKGAPGCSPDAPAPILKVDLAFLSRHRRGRLRQRAELILRRGQVQVGLDELVPLDDLTGIRGLAAHDRRQGRVGDLLRLVQRVAAAAAGDQVLVLLDVGVDAAARGLPGRIAVVVRDAVDAVAPALGADDRLAHVARALRPMAAHAEHMHVVRVGEVHAEMVPTVAVLRLRPHLLAAD